MMTSGEPGQQRRPTPVEDRLRLLCRLGGGPSVLRHSAARWLGGLPDGVAAEALAETIALARAGMPEAKVVLPALLRALDEEGELGESAELLRRVAAVSQLDTVEQLFGQARPAREYAESAAARADARLFSMPLGVLKSRARLTTNPDELERLAVVSNPAVVREVLKNPRLTEPLVVRVAARRPARPEPLVEIHRSRWCARPAVRRALALNPYLPVEVGARLVPLLSLTDLVELAGDGSLHAVLRAQAATLLGRAGDDGAR